jgi:hypothetical protein
VLQRPALPVRPLSADFAPELTVKLAIEELFRQLNGENQDHKISIKGFGGDVRKIYGRFIFQYTYPTVY